MWILILIAIAFIAMIALLFSNFGKDLTKKTDGQLAQRYLLACSLESRGIGQVDFAERFVSGKKNESEVTLEELVRRGYDSGKLISEIFNAQYEERPVDFSKCRAEN